MQAALRGRFNNRIRVSEFQRRRSWRSRGGESGQMRFRNLFFESRIKNTTVRASFVWPMRK